MNRAQRRQQQRAEKKAQQKGGTSGFEITKFATGSNAHYDQDCRLWVFKYCKGGRDDGYTLWFPPPCGARSSSLHPVCWSTCRHMVLGGDIIFDATWEAAIQSRK